MPKTMDKEEKKSAAPAKSSSSGASSKSVAASAARWTAQAAASPSPSNPQGGGNTGGGDEAPPSGGATPGDLVGFSSPWIQAGKGPSDVFNPERDIANQVPVWGAMTVPSGVSSRLMWTGKGNGEHGGVAYYGSSGNKIGVNRDFVRMTDKEWSAIFSNLQKTGTPEAMDLMNRMVAGTVGYAGDEGVGKFAQVPGTYRGEGWAMDKAVLDRYKKMVDWIDPVKGRGGGSGGGRGGRDGGGGGGGGETPAVTPTATPRSYSVEGAPNWWSGWVPGEAGQEKFGLTNALIPVMSPEDQRTNAAWLSQQNPTAFGSYANVAYPPPPSQITPEMREQYTTRDRIRLFSNTLDKYVSASGKQEAELGDSFRFFRQIANVLEAFSGGPVGVGAPQTEAQRSGMQAALSPYASQVQAGGSMEQYANQYRGLTNPFFTAGQI